jgi:hypothetical protein
VGGATDVISGHSNSSLLYDSLSGKSHILHMRHLDRDFKLDRKTSL